MEPLFRISSKNVDDPCMKRLQLPCNYIHFE